MTASSKSRDDFVSHISLVQVCILSKSDNSGHTWLHIEGNASCLPRRGNTCTEHHCVVELQARKGEADSTPDDILSMVKAQAQPPHR